MLTTDTTYVVTVELDTESFAWLNGLRKQHFPADRNFLDAHLTLFHTIDRDGRDIVRHSDQRARQSVELEFGGLRFLGRGVAVEVTSQALIDIRQRLAADLVDRLTPQDRQSFRPHVTIQNKVESKIARALFDDMSADFAPRAGRATAILVWEYLGGPWKLSDRIAFDDGSGS